MNSLAMYWLISSAVIVIALLIIYLLVPPDPRRIGRDGHVASKMLKEPMHGLTWSFVINIVAFTGIVVIYDIEEQSQLLLLIVRLLILLMACVEVWFYLCLGILAYRLGRSPVKWVIVNLLISPFGMVLAYFLMRRKVKQAQSAPPS